MKGLESLRGVVAQVLCKKKGGGEAGEEAPPLVSEAPPAGPPLELQPLADALGEREFHVGVLG